MYVGLCGHMCVFYRSNTWNAYKHKSCHPHGFLVFAGCIGFFCPCFLFAKNAEFLGSGTLVGSCMTHLIFWALVNTVCCFLSDGILLGLPGCFVACYACGYRRALRSKYNIEVCS